MTEQKSRLVIEISTENAKRNAELLNQELQKLTEKGDKASASSSALGKELKSTSESTKTLGDSTSKATKELAQQESQLNKNGTAVVQLAKYVASYLTISKAISMADGYTQMAARIKNATANAQEYALVQERLYETANTTYRSLAEAQEVYLSMSGGMKSLGYNTAQTLDMTDSLSFAFTANATRADQAQSAMDALSKSMAKGKVDADAWISIVTGADNVIADMAKTTGKSEAEIRQLGATGKISLEDLIKTLIQTKDANEALANNMENSFADGMQKLFNATQKFLGELNKSTGATSNLASGLGFLADHVDTVAIAGGVVASIYAGRVAAAFVLSAQKAVWNTAAMVTQTTAMNTAAVSARSLYLALGGPVGLGIAIAGTAASYFLLKDNTKTATVELDKQGKSVADLTIEYNNLSEAQQRAFKYQEEVKLKELSEEYKEAQQQVRAYASSIAEVAAKDEATKNSVRELIKAFDDKKITAEQLANKINALSGVGTDNKVVMDKHAVASTNAKDALESQKRVTEALSGSIRKMGDDAKRTTSEITALNAKLAKFSDKKNDALYISQNAKGWGGDIEKAKALLEFRKELGLGATGRSLNADEQAGFNDYWKAVQGLSKYEEKITKEKRDQTKETEKQLKTLQLSAQVQANAVKYNFSGLESKYGLPNGMLSALHAIETGNTGKTNQVNKTTGATGGFQFLEGTAKQYGVKDRTNLAQSAEGAAKYMAYLLKLFKGDLEKAVRAYHAGEGNVQKGTNIGKYNNDYIAKYIGYTAGQGGITGDFKDVESYLNEQYQLQLKTQQEIDQLKEQYSNADVLRSKKRISEIADAEKLGQQDLIPQINARYNAQDEIAKLQLDAELNAYKWTEEQKLQNTHDLNVQRLTAEGQYSEQQKELVKKALDEQLAYELDQYKRTQQWKLLELRQSIESQQREANKIIQEFQLKQQFGVGNNYQQALLGLSSAETDRQTTVAYESDINSYRKQLEDKQLTEDEFHQIALEREQAYLDQKLANQLQYDQNVKELFQNQHDIQVNIWQDLLTRTGTVFGQMAEMVKNTSGESSAAYKAMFLTNQGISMAQAMINTEVAATKAMAEGGMIAGVPMAAAIRALGYASVGMIAAQTIAGFSEGGYTGHGGKYDPAGIVHKGEVVFSQADIARLGGVGVVEAMRKGQKGYSDGGVVGSPKLVNFKMGEIKQQAPVINIHNAPPGTTATQNSDGSVDIDLVERQLANRLSNANSVISKSLKQNTTASRRR
jgi:tape measure domain-containing protein